MEERRTAGPCSVLVVEDDDDLRALMAEVIRNAGWLPLEAATGVAVLDLVRQHAPRLVILDVFLPGLCGYEICRALRDEFGPSLPIMFISGKRTESSDRVAGLLLGADEYLAKPFSLDEMLVRARVLLRRNAAMPRAVASLTSREREVLRFLALGMSLVEIAAHLCMSPKTIRTHFEHIFLKLGVRSRAQAVALAYRDDLVPARRGNDPGVGLVEPIVTVVSGAVPQRGP